MNKEVIKHKYKQEAKIIDDKQINLGALKLFGKLLNNGLDNTALAYSIADEITANREAIKTLDINLYSLFKRLAKKGVG